MLSLEAVLAIVYAVNQFINFIMYEYLQWTPHLKSCWWAMDLNIKKKNSMASVRKRTIPTERPSLVSGKNI
jgi:hypothetical protein